MEDKLLKRKSMGNLRKLEVFPMLADFSSNDYLGLAKSIPFSYLVFKEWKNSSKIGSTGSRLLTGNSVYIEELENKIAALHGFETGLIFNCGYMANVGLISAIANDKDTIFFDVKVHASTRDGIALSQAKAFPFRHNDLEHLEKRLKKRSSQGKCFICVESIYSTDGSLVPLREIVKLSKEYEAQLIVDEAHAVGVYGKRGLGLVNDYAVNEDIFAVVITFGKALGASGAVVLGSLLLKQLLINFATSFIYTTALPFPILAAIQCSYNLYPSLENERKQIAKLISIFRNNFPKASETHIQALEIPGNNTVQQAAQKLRSAGFDIRALTSPTVRKGEEKLRICLHAFNTEKELSQLLEKVLCLTS